MVLSAGFQPAGIITSSESIVWIAVSVFKRLLKFLPTYLKLMESHYEMCIIVYGLLIRV